MNESLFAERLKEARKNIGLSQAAIAEKCGVSRETWSRYESGKLTPGMDVFAALAAKGADVNYILTGTKSETQRRLDVLKSVTEKVSEMDLPEKVKKELLGLLYEQEVQAVENSHKQLTPREAALLDNYQHTDDYGKNIIEATAFAAAEQKQVKKG